MKKLLLLSAVLVFTCLRLLSQNASSNMQHSSTDHIMINVNDLKWMDAPPGLPTGAKVAVLSGDPGKEGPFALRVTFPENYRVPAHWHPKFENVVVLDGTLYMGSGEKLDETKAMPLDAGGYSSIPAKAPHYVFTKGNVTIQINSEGPFAITYFNPADDPRNQK
jgi:uncharacterized RmlC-like cupin family protein